MRADTVDEKDERLTDTHYASEAAARDLPVKAKGAKAKAKAVTRTYRVRLTIVGTRSSAEEIKAVLEAVPGTRVTRVREVA